MLDILFSSQNRVSLLSWLFSHDGTPHTASQIVKGAGVDLANATRELKRLVTAGLVVLEDGPRPRYVIERKNPYYEGLKIIFEQYSSGNPEDRFAVLSKKYDLTTLSDSDAWMLGEDIPDIDLFFSQIWLHGFANEFIYPSGRAYKKILTVFRGYHLWFYYGVRDSAQEAETIVRKMIKKPLFAEKINSEIVKVADELRTFADTIPQSTLESLTNAELWRLYRTHYEIHTRYYQWCWIPVAVDMFNGCLTDTLKGVLQRYVSSQNAVNETFMLLTQPMHVSLIQKEEEDLLELVASIRKDAYHRKLFTSLYRTFEEQHAAPLGLGTHTPEYQRLLERRIDQMRSSIKSAVLKKIERHYRENFYVKFMWLGKDGVHTFEHYLREVVTWVGRGADAAGNLAKIRSERKVLAKKRMSLLKKLNVSREHTMLFNAFGDFMVTKIYRRYAQIYAIYRMQPVLAEIAQRAGMTIMQARFLLKSEVCDFLTDGVIDRQSLEARTQMCVYYTEKEKDRIITGQDAEYLASCVEQKNIGSVSELKGQTGCMGHAEGVVKIITRPSDMGKMNTGDILVSIATDPDIVPAMKKAAAIVTEQGGVTSHAAIVARELNIPCVIGTKIATRVLKDGDRVSVDANKGIVKLIS